MYMQRLQLTCPHVFLQTLKTFNWENKSWSQAAPEGTHVDLFCRYVYTAHWMGLRWPKPSNGPWAPCMVYFTLLRKLIETSYNSLVQRITHTHPFLRERGKDEDSLF